MSNQRINMNKLRQIIRLKDAGTSHKALARRLGLSRTTIVRYVQRLQASGLSYPQLLTLSDAELDTRFEPVVSVDLPSDSRYATLQALFPALEVQLKQVGVTRQLLWQEYRTRHPDGYLYTQFCHNFRRWLQGQQVSLHQEQKAGEKVLVDFTGQLLSIVDRQSGQVTPVQVLVAVLGASQYAYVEAVMSQQQAVFINALENALHYFGGVPLAIVVDNLKAAVHQASRYEPSVNETFEDFALHYQTSVLPTRPAKPKDKALVEGAVRIVYQRIFAPLRQQVFFDLACLNKAIQEALLAYNGLRFQGRPYSRQDLFDRVEKASLQALPAQRYPLRHYRWARVQKNAHVLLSEDKHYYSVPYRYTGQRVKLVYSASGVDIYQHYERIAFHARDYRPFQYTTLADHLPSTHRFVAEWNPERFQKWAADIGPQTKVFITALLASKKHPEQGYKASMGVLSLAGKVGKQRLEKACNRALYYQNYSYRTVHNILEKGLDNCPESDPSPVTLPLHENIRGKDYYQ